MPARSAAAADGLCRLAAAEAGDRWQCHFLGMALRVQSAGASPRRTGHAGHRRHLSGRLRGGAQSAAAQKCWRTCRDETAPGDCRADPAYRYAKCRVCGRGGPDCNDPCDRCRALWRTGGTTAEGNRAAAARAERSSDPPHGDRRQLHRRLLPHRVFRPLQPPGVPGMEAAGLIEAVGSAVSGFSVGDRVAYACPPVGAYSERRNMAPELLVRLSDDIRDETAAASHAAGHDRPLPAEG